MTMQNSRTLGERIVSRREALGLKQRDLAVRADLSVTFISEIENDKRNLSSESLLSLADALGVSTDYILKGEEAKQHLSEPLIIPPELTVAAEEMNWSLNDTRDLLKARGMVVARRSRHSKADDATKIFSKHDWIEFYKEFFGDD